MRKEVAKISQGGRYSAVTLCYFTNIDEFNIQLGDDSLHSIPLTRPTAEALLTALDIALGGND